MPLPYEGSRAALATCHGKAQAIAPPLAAWTGLALVVPEGLDTDSLGTFTGEVTRPAPMRETARMKARLGMAASGLPFGIASEGSFGPHPVLPFVAAAHELLLLVDDVQGIEIAEVQTSENTNFATLDITPGDDLEAFLSRVGFPEHALIVRAGKTLTKGIHSPALLTETIARGLREGPVRIETDMRAHMNPTRMKEIARLADTFARRIATACPVCAAPGFGIIRSMPGLPCCVCATPTPLVRARVMGCARCGHEALHPRTDGRNAAAAAECPECNP